MFSCLLRVCLDRLAKNLINYKVKKWFYAFKHLKIKKKEEFKEKTVTSFVCKSAQLFALNSESKW